MEIVFAAACQRWEAITDFSERFAPKEAGFQWNPEIKRWVSSDARVANRLREHASAETQALLDAAVIQAVESARRAQELESAKEAAQVAASRAQDADIVIPAPAGLSYLPYQKAGIAYAFGRKDTLIADEPGLGKTIVTLGVANLLLGAGKEHIRMLVVAPKIALWNWRREAEKWLIKPHVISLWTTKRQADADIVIINYDILAKLKTVLTSQTWDIVVFDEAHALKEGRAARTKAALGCYREGTQAIAGKRRLFLTGTPILNRPSELFTILNSMQQPYAKSFTAYAERYCNGRKSSFGYDSSGASHLDELQTKLRSSIMVRRLKSDVLQDLAPKRYSVFEMEASTSELRKAIAAEQAAMAANIAAAPAKLEVQRAMASGDAKQVARAMRFLKSGPGVPFDEISRLRHDTAVAKIPLVIEHLVSLLEGSDESILCMAHHQDVIAGIVEGLAEAGYQAAVITGDTSDADRQRAQDDIQGHRKRVFVGSMRACGVAITLSAASTVVFAEQDWTPGVMTQAEDRAHRIGQQGSVLVQHLVVDGSMDVSMAHAVASKAGVIDSALDALHTSKEADEAEVVVQPANAEAVEAPALSAEPEITEAMPLLHEHLPETSKTRPRGRPRLGDHVMSSTERSRASRAAHDVKTVTMPAELAARVRELREERGERSSAVLWAALNALESKPRSG